jgi:serine/threonine-protein kinase
VSNAPQLGRYLLVRRLGGGGMGDIFLARQQGIGGIERYAIVKTLRSELADDAGHKEQFLDEARVASMLNHPNIVATWDMGEDNGVTYIAMEYVAGVDLLQLQHEAHRTVGDTVVPAFVSAAVVRDAALGLDYTHHAVDEHGRAMNVVHRDISPQNVMIRQDGLVKIVDFGLARSTMRQHMTANSNTIKGKLAYMSPEQASAGRLDGRSDQYSLGVVFWELLARRARFQIEHPMAILLAIGSEDVPPPSSVRPDIDPALDAIVGRMLARNPDHRFPRMRDVADALAAWLQSKAASVDVAGFVQQVAGATIQTRVKVTANDELALRSALPRVAVGPIPVAQQTEEATLSAVHAPSAPAPVAAAPASVAPAATARPAALGAPVATPGVFVGLGEALLASPLNPLLSPLQRMPGSGPEEREVIAIAGQFATPLAANAPPADRQTRERAWLDELAQLATNAQGVVLRSSASDFVIVFGARNTTVDDGVRALRVALHLVAVAERHAGVLACAIDAGSARVAREGRLRVDGAVVDRAAALASRAATTAGAGTWSTQSALRAMREKAAVDATRALTVPGFDGADALSGIAVRGVVDVDPAARGACLGRADVLRGLVGLLSEVEQGRPTAVVISSEPGGGRSRVLREVQALSHERGVRAVRVVDETGILVVDIARALSRALATLQGELATRVRARAVALGDTLGDARTDGVNVGDDPQQAVRLLARLQGVLIDAAALQPLVLLLDDNDDRDGRAVAGLLLRVILPLVGSSKARLGAVVTGDADTLHAAFAAGAHHVPLAPLARAAIADVARAAVGDLPLPDVVEDFVVARAHGNPDLAQQVVRALLQTGLIERTDKAIVARSNLASASVPDELGRLLRARVEKLPIAAQTALAVAAVVDLSFPGALVGAAAGLVPVDGALDELRRRGFIEVDELPTAGQDGASGSAWRFVSAVTRQAVLGLLHAPQRAALHARVFEALQANGDLLPAARRWPALALHAEAAGRPIEAGRAWAQVARLRHRGGELDAAAGAAERALGLVEAAGPSAAHALPGIAAIAVSCWMAVDAARAVAVGERSLASTSTSTGDAAAVAALEGACVRALLRRARHRDAEELARRALKRPIDVEARATLWGLCAQALEAQGRLTEASEAVRAAFAEMGGRPASDPDFYWSQLNLLGRLCLKVGDTTQARTFFEQAEAQARDVDSAAGIVKALSNRAVVHAHQREFDAAQAVLARALSWADDAGDLLGAAGVHYNRARLFADQQRFAPAQEAVDLAAALAVQIGWSEGVALTSSLRDGLRRTTAAR